MNFIHTILVNLHYNHVPVLEGKATKTKVDSQDLEHKELIYFSCDISGQLRLYFTVTQGLRLMKILFSAGGLQYCHCHFHSIQSEGRNGMKKHWERILARLMNGTDHIHLHPNE